MIRTKRFAFRNAHQREVERMPLHQIERLWIAAECDRNVLRSPPKFPLRRLPLPLFDVFQIYFAHRSISLRRWSEFPIACFSTRNWCDFATRDSKVVRASLTVVKTGKPGVVE